MTFLITGATGNIGSRGIKRLIERNVRPRVFVRDLAKARARFGDDVDVFVGDLGDPEGVVHALKGVVAENRCAFL